MAVIVPKLSHIHARTEEAIGQAIREAVHAVKQAPRMVRRMRDSGHLLVNTKRIFIVSSHGLISVFCRGSDRVCGREGLRGRNVAPGRSVGRGIGAPQTQRRAAGG